MCFPPCFCRFQLPLQLCRYCWSWRKRHEPINQHCRSDVLHHRALRVWDQVLASAIPQVQLLTSMTSFGTNGGIMPAVIRICSIKYCCLLGGKKRCIVRRGLCFCKMIDVQISCRQVVGCNGIAKCREEHQVVVFLSAGLVFICCNLGP